MAFHCYNGGTKAPKCYVSAYIACRAQNKVCLHNLFKLCECFDTQMMAFNVFMRSDLFRDFPN
jgi:hypothetical protein